MNKNVYRHLCEFKSKYPMSIGWRLKSHAKIIEEFLNPDEQVLYGFFAQKNDHSLDVITTNAVVLTNKRILIGTKRLLFGYFYTAITPDMFNDLKVEAGLVWGKVHIDTVNEYVTLSNIDKNALNDIETNITEYMIKEKRKYQDRLPEEHA